MDVKRRILRGSVIILFFNTLIMPIGYATRILYSHTLSIEMYGLFYAIVSFFGILTTYNDLNLGYSVIYYLPKFFQKKDYQSCWNIYVYNQVVSLVITFILSAILIFCAPFLALHYFKTPDALNLIYIFIIFFIANSFVSATNNFFSGLQEEEYYSSKEFIRLFFILLFSIIFLFVQINTVVAFALAWSGAYICTALIYLYIMYTKHAAIIRPITWDKKLFSLLFHYASPTLIATLIGTFATTDIIFLTFFKGVKEVGIYNIIIPVTSIAATFLMPISGFFYPLISHLMEEKKENVSKIIEKTLRYVPFIVFYVSLFIFIFPNESVGLLFGTKWLPYTKIPLRILTFSVIVSNLLNYLVTAALGLGLVKQRLIISIIVTAINIIVSYFLIQTYGITGAVIANLIVCSISVVLYSFVINRKVAFRWPFIFYVKTGVFGAFLYWIVSIIGIQLHGWIQFITAGIVYTALVACFAWYMKLFDKDIVQAILQKYQSIVSRKY